jgi:Na+/H+ antiporter NhaD/arsenite permease-like protein
MQSAKEFIVSPLGIGVGASLASAALLILTPLKSLLLDKNGKIRFEEFHPKLLLPSIAGILATLAVLFTPMGQAFQLFMASLIL